jgi:tryptophanyl-tRNA synthetase
METEQVSLSGGVVEVRGLTVAQMEAVKKLAGANQNILAIAFATGFEHDDVKAWYHSDATSAADVGKLTDAIARVSGLDEGAQFPRSAGNDVVVQRAGA